MKNQKFMSGTSLTEKEDNLVFNSVEENEEILKSLGVNQQIRQLKNEKFQSKLISKSLLHFELFADRFNTKILVNLESPEDKITILFPHSKNNSIKILGEHAGNNKIIIIPNRFEVDIIAEGFSGSEAIIISKSYFLKTINHLYPDNDFSSKLNIIEGNPLLINKIRKQIHNFLLCSEERQNQENSMHFLTHTFDCLYQPDIYSKVKKFSYNHNNVYIAKLIQEYIEENYNNVITMQKLCELTGLGVRTIQKIFKGYFDVSITEYILTTRLYHAHYELSKSNSMQKKISSVALDNGFTHLSRFSTHYRKRYGVSPKQTLNQSLIQ